MLWLKIKNKFMSSRYKYQEMLYKNGNNKIEIPHKCRVICCDEYENNEPPSYILYNSKEDFLNALEEEKTRKVGGTLYGDNVIGYDL